MKKITFLLAMAAATFAMTAQTITVTKSAVEVTTNASDEITAFTPNDDFMVTFTGFAPGQTGTFFNQVRLGTDETGPQIGGGGKPVTMDASGNATETVSLGIFGTPVVMTADGTFFWNSNFGGVSGNTTFDATIPSLSSDDFSKEDISAAISPNPVSSILSVAVEADSYSLIDLAGKTVLTQAATGSIDVSGLTAGVYLLVTEAGSAKVVVE